MSIKYPWIAAALCVLATPTQVYAQAQAVTGLTVNYVYQLHHVADSFEFEAAMGQPHACGSKLYRVTDMDPDRLARHFTLVLTAFTTDKKLSIWETGVCAGGGRMSVGWTRLTN
ncbi:MAG: hypothetical protein AAGI28_12965 [Pseudomonadota bacterium]